jgi:hypothetical protein
MVEVWWSRRKWMKREATHRTPSSIARWHSLSPIDHPISTLITTEFKSWIKTRVRVGIRVASVNTCWWGRHERGSSGFLRGGERIASGRHTVSGSRMLGRWLKECQSFRAASSAWIPYHRSSTRTDKESLPRLSIDGLLVPGQQTQRRLLE